MTVNWLRLSGQRHCGHSSFRSSQWLKQFWWKMWWHTFIITIAPSGSSPKEYFCALSSIQVVGINSYVQIEQCRSLFGLSIASNFCSHSGVKIRKNLISKVWNYASNDLLRFSASSKSFSAFEIFSCRVFFSEIDEASSKLFLRVSRAFWKWRTFFV